MLRAWIVLIACSVVAPALAEPTLFIAGDSTAAHYDGPGQQGWGEPFAQYFDSSKINVANRARGGRSSRTFITEGHWSALLDELRPGDIVLLQFGHNDAGALNQEPPESSLPLRARGTIPGIGDESEEIDNVVTGKHEVVHSYGWYLRQMIDDVRAHDATPILLTLTVRNTWDEAGYIECGEGSYREWAKAVAQTEQVPLVDVRRIIADRYQKLGPDAVAAFFENDHIHTNAAGADFNARAVVAGLLALHEPGFAEFLSQHGSEIGVDRGPAKDSACPALQSP
jgi:lysophospholipase L1-like esterase